MYRLGSRQRGRRRALDLNKKRLLCDAVARGATLAQAAATVGVSLRTVQREARLDHDFDQELRTAHAATPDPLSVMRSAARTHWRAAAWLLERTHPENYGRRPASACSPAQFDAALNVLVEAALQQAPASEHARLYAHLNAAVEVVYRAVFPHQGPFGRRLVERLPATPLADAQRLELFRNPPPHCIVPDPLQPAQPAEPEPPAQPAAPRQFRALPEGGPPSPAEMTPPAETPGQRPGLPTGELAEAVDDAPAVHQTETVPQPSVPAPRRIHPAEGANLAAHGARRSLPVQVPKLSLDPPTPDARLPWQYNLRVARTSPAARGDPARGGFLDPPILSHLSPKTASATELERGDKSPPAPPHSATATNPVE